MEEKVSHPSHYQHAGYECLDIARCFCFDLGNAYKYVWRAGEKKEQGLSGQEKAFEDYSKAITYMKDYLCHMGYSVLKKPEGINFNDLEGSFEEPKRGILKSFHMLFDDDAPVEQIAKNILFDLRLNTYSAERYIAIERAAKSFAEKYSGEDIESAFCNGAEWAIEHRLT